MSTEKWSAFAAATSIGASDALVGLQGGVNKRFPQSVIGGGILQKTVPLTNDQIIHLPTAGVDVLPAPGAGKGNIPLLVVMAGNSLAGAYTNVNAGCIFYLANDAAGDFDNVTISLTGFLTSGAKHEWGVLTPYAAINTGNIVALALSAAFSDWNTPTQIWANNKGNGDFTGGDPANTLKVNVFYAVVDL